MFSIDIFSDDEYISSDDEFDLNFTISSLNRTHYRVLKKMCKFFGLNPKGKKFEIIDRLLEYRDSKDKKLKRHLEDCKVEAEHLSKKRKIEIPNHVTICKYDISFDIFRIILEFLPINKELLDGPGMVNSQWYLVTRSKEIWETITLKEDSTFLIPLVMLKGCKKLRLMDKFSHRSVKHIIQYCDNVTHLTAEIYGWDNHAIELLFSNEMINSNLKYLEILEWNGYTRTADVAKLVIDKISSKELQCLKVNATKTYTLKNGLQYFKEMANKFPKLRWLEIFNWKFPGDYLDPVLTKEIPIRRLRTILPFSFRNNSAFEQLEANLGDPVPSTVFDSVKVLKIYRDLRSTCNSMDLSIFPNLEKLEINARVCVKIPKTVKCFICMNESSYELYSSLKSQHLNIESLRLSVGYDHIIHGVVWSFPNVRELKIFLPYWNKVKLDGIKKLKELKELKSLEIGGSFDYLEEYYTPNEIKDTWKEFVNELPNLENFIVNNEIIKGKRFVIPFNLPDIIE